MCEVSQGLVSEGGLHLYSYNRFEFSFPSPRPVAISRLKNLVFPAIYP